MTIEALELQNIHQLKTRITKQYNRKNEIFSCWLLKKRVKNGQAK